MNYLVTGASGFVGQHFIELIRDLEPNACIYGVSRRHHPELEQLGVKKQFASCLDNISEISRIFEETHPDYVLHLASQSSVARSWVDPAESFKNNTSIFLNILEAIRKFDLKNMRILSVGSSDQYGKSGITVSPLTEDAPLQPLSPYAVARVAQEQLGEIYHKGFNIDVISTRSFNHLGRGQTDKFVVSSFVKQAVEIKLGQRQQFHCGDTTIVRDFIDVRDVARAYHQLFKSGHSGEVYNICSGVGHSLNDVINIIKKIVEVDFNVHKDPSLIRPVETPLIIGSNDKIKRDVNFELKYNLEDSIRELKNYWIKSLRAG